MQHFDVLRTFKLQRFPKNVTKQTLGCCDNVENHDPSDEQEAVSDRGVINETRRPEARQKLTSNIRLLARVLWLEEAQMLSDSLWL